jgi:splicing factor 3B subunit 2
MRVISDRQQRKAGDVEIALDIDADGDLSQAELKARYEASKAESSRVYVPGADVDRTEFGDVIAGEMKKRARKEDVAKKGDKGKGKEKFKF